MIDDESREGMSDNRFKGHWEDRSIAILYDERPPPSYNQEADLNAEIYLGVCNESLNMIRNLERYLNTLYRQRCECATRLFHNGARTSL